MKAQERIEHSKFLINRFDNYMEGANSKGNFLLAFSTAIFGFVAFNYNEVVEFNNCRFEKISIILIVSIALLSIFSAVFTILAVNPFLKNMNKKNEDFKSLVFFKSISSLSENEFINKYLSQMNKELDIDLSKQVYSLSKGLNIKFLLLKLAVYSVLVQLFLIICLILIKIL